MLITDCPVGQTFEGFVLVKSATLKTASNGSKFWDLTLSDPSGEINAKIWKPGEGLEIRAKELHKVRGRIDEWQGRPQMSVDRIRRRTPEDDVSMDDFVPAAPMNPDEMLSRLFEAVDQIQDEDLRAIVNFRLQESADALKIIPASMRFHHAYRGGLLYHTYTMLGLARAVLPVYPLLNADLLISGVLLHDLSKAQEYCFEPTGLADNYSFDGQMLGHLVQGAIKLETAGRALNTPEEKLRLLEHMLISHHYEPEFGSPRKPLFPEAEMLHYLDIIDARMEDMRHCLRNIAPGEFSDKVWSLENRKIYRHTLGPVPEQERE